MIKRKFGRIVNITSAAVKAPIDILALSNGPAFNWLVAGPFEKPSSTTTINGILPGLFETDTMKWRMREGAKMEGISEFDYTKQKVSHIPAGRPGVPRSSASYARTYVVSILLLFQVKIFLLMEVPIPALFKYKLLLEHVK